MSQSERKVATLGEKSNRPLAPQGEGPSVSYRNVSISYVHGSGSEEATLAVADVSIDIAKGSFTSIIGPSGCGKTSLIRLCAGFQVPTKGTVHCNGKDVRGINFETGYVTQQTNLYPWMTTRENVEFALTVRGMPADERHRRSDGYLSAMGLSEFANRYPYQLSGGMQKRACIAQTLIYEPPILLMDEPFAGLDAQTRLAVEADLLRLWSDLRPTIVFITHDLTEAITLSDEVVVMSARPGRVKMTYHVPLGRPRDVHEVQADPRFGLAYQELWDGFRSPVPVPLARSAGTSGDEEGTAHVDRPADIRVATSTSAAITAPGKANQSDSSVKAPSPLWGWMAGRSLKIRAAQFAILVVILGLWEVLSDAHILDPTIFSHPIGVIQELVTLLSGQPVEQRVIYPQIWITFGEMALGFLIGSAIGVLLAVVLGRNRTFAEVTVPFILAWYGIPIITIAPLFVLILGIGFNAKVGTAVVTTVFAVFFQTYSGVRALNEEQFLLGRLMGASRLDLFRRVLIPGSLPFIFNGLRMAVPLAMTGAIVGEFIVSTAGLGSFILDASNSFDAAGTFAGIVIVVAVVTICAFAIDVVERLVIRWRPGGR